MKIHADNKHPFTSMMFDDSSFDLFVQSTENHWDSLQPHTPTHADATTTTDEEPLNKAQSYINNRKATCLVHQGHSYSLKYKKKCGDSTWRCTKRSCCGTATVRQSDDEYLVVSVGRHSDSCPPDEASCMEKVVRAQIATDGSNISTRWLAQQQQLPSSKNNRSFRFFSGAQIKSQIMLHVCRTFCCGGGGV
jgi:hypothetical protein